LSLDGDVEEVAGCVVVDDPGTLVPGADSPMVAW
jgi:hypothetical protein